MSQKNAILVIIVAIALLSTVVVWGPALMHAPVPAQSAVNHYEDAYVGFDYVKTYALQNRSDNFAGHPVTVITLIDANVQIPDMSEGPPGISVLVISNPEHTSLETWIQNESISLFYLSGDKKLAATAVAGEPALAYTYSGLYENDAVAVAHGDNIFLFFGSWADANGAIRSDFQNLLKTVTFK